MTTPCMLCNSQSIYKAISEHLGIHFGGTLKYFYNNFESLFIQIMPNFIRNNA